MEIYPIDGIVPGVTITGEIDYGNRDRFREALQNLADRGFTDVEVDLSGVDFIDSSGISILLEYAKLFNRNGGKLTFAAFSPVVYRTLFGCGLTDIFGIKGNTGSDMNDPFSHNNSRWLVSSFRVPSGLTSPSVIRDRISQLVEDLALSEAEVADIRLAVGEAATNAVKYGCKTCDDQVSILCSADSAELVIEITDPGPGFDPKGVPEPVFHSLPPGGMGIALMKLVMDDVKFVFGTGTTVRMVKRLR